MASASSASSSGPSSCSSLALRSIDYLACDHERYPCLGFCALNGLLGSVAVAAIARLDSFKYISAFLAVGLCVGVLLGMVVQPREGGGDTAREVKRKETLVTRHNGKGVQAETRSCAMCALKICTSIARYWIRMLGP